MRAQNLTLLTDLYELTMMQGYYENPSDQIVVFDAFYRKNPCGGAYAVCAGLEQVIEYVRDLHFSPDDIDYLRSLHIFNDDFLEYLRGFHFTGDIYAIPEGTVVFPREPLLKVGGTACRDRDSEHDQPSEPDRDESIPRCLRGKGRRHHGVWTPPCTGTGCRYLRRACCHDRRLHRNLQCPDRTDV